MPDDKTPAATSTATEVTPEATEKASDATEQTAEATPAIETWTEAQLTEWRKTGNTPEPPEPKQEKSAASKPEGDDKTPKSVPKSGAEKVQEGKSEERKDEDKSSEQPKKPDETEGHESPRTAKRIRQLLRDRAEADARADEAERRLAERSGAKPPADKPTASAEDKPKPRAVDFDDYDQYVEALTDWKVEQREKVNARENAQRHVDSERAAVEKSWATTQGKFAEEHDDYEEVIGNRDLPPIPESALVAIKVSGRPDIAYYLAKHPEQIEALAKLNPVQCVMAISDIGTSLTKPSEKPKEKQTPEQKKVTNAAPPATELSGKDTATEDPVRTAVQDGNFERYKREKDAREKRV